MTEIKDKKVVIKPVITILILATAIFLLSIISRYNYLLFHSLIEIFSILIAGGTFILGWNMKQKTDNRALLYLSFAYLFIAGFDLIHLLSYKGMGVFTTNNDYATRLWICARYLESLSLLTFLTIPFKKRLNPFLLILVYTILSALLLSSIFYFDIFPICYDPATGLTLFKIASEYIICFILLITIGSLIFQGTKQDSESRFYLLISIILTIMSELSFTLYSDVYGIMNQLGHYLKLLSFYFIYKSFIESALKRPLDILFKGLKENERTLTLDIESRNKLFSILAHDLKSPFTGLVGFLNILDLNYDNLTEETRLKYIKYCKISADNCLILFNNILSWAQMQLEKNITNIPRRVNILELVESNFNLYRSNLLDKKIEAECEIDRELSIFIDQDILGLVIRNLLSNAIKYTPIGGKISVRAQMKAKSLCDIIISDNGIGLTKEELDNIANRQKLNSRAGTNKEVGTGLGLFLVMDFIKKIDGTIKAESSPEKGTRFIITLPAR